MFLEWCMLDVLPRFMDIVYNLFQGFPFVLYYLIFGDNDALHVTMAVGRRMIIVLRHVEGNRLMTHAGRQRLKEKPTRTTLWLKPG